jgi:hypothetical protein
MKKKIFLLVVVFLLVSFIGSLAIAGNKGTSGPAGESNRAFLYLYQKCSGSETDGFCAPTFNIFAACPLTDDLTLDRVPGAWGKLKYNLRGPTFDYEFEGHGLKPGNYTLIYYQDNCGYDFVSLGSDITKEDGKEQGHGNVHIKGSLATGDLPALTDQNCINIITEPDGSLICGIGSGAKIWLVLSDDIYVPVPQFLGWHPNMYLFEEIPITYTYTFD